MGRQKGQRGAEELELSAQMELRCVNCCSVLAPQQHIKLQAVSGASRKEPGRKVLGREARIWGINGAKLRFIYFFE